jgi:hypothetical protein
VSTRSRVNMGDSLPWPRQEVAAPPSTLGDVEDLPLELLVLMNGWSATVTVAARMKRIKVNPVSVVGSSAINRLPRKLF